MLIQFQLTETGQIGVLGVTVQSRVVEAVNFVLAAVTILPQPLVDSFVLEKARSQGNATPIFVEVRRMFFFELLCRYSATQPFLVSSRKERCVTTLKTAV